MAKIKFTKGQLYFLREKDYLTDEISRYVKIGLVRNQKETKERISEHQTGNPREIYNYRSIDSPFVEHLETLIHYRFAEKWITGEWLDLDEKEIETAIEEGEKIVQEQMAIKEELEESYNLSDIESSGELKNPSAVAKEVWEQLISCKLEVDQLNVKKIIVVHHLKKHLGKYEGINGVANLVSKNGSEKFEKSQFENENPDLYEKYTKETRKFSNLFTIKDKKTVKNEYPDLYLQKKELEKVELTALEIKKDQKADRNKDIDELHASYINLQKELYTKEWKYAQLEAKLKVYTGESSGIEGLCGWNREFKTTKEFDKKQFQEDHPELYEKYSYREPDKFSFNVNSWRPYYSGN